MESSGFERLSITAGHLAVLRTIPAYHRDPFDHLLIAQSILEASSLISTDPAFRDYAVDLFEG